MAKKKRLTEWADEINLMTEDELQFAIQHPIGCYPEFLKMVWGKNCDPYLISENKAMAHAIANMIEEWGGRCEMEKREKVFLFFFQGARFSFFFDEYYNYITVVDDSWKDIKLCNSQVVEKMKRAINKANIWNNVTLAYLIDEEDGVMEIYGSSSIPYYPNLTYLKKSLYNKLIEMLGTHELVDSILQEENEDDVMQRFSHAAPGAAN